MISTTGYVYSTAAYQTVSESRTSRPCPSALLLYRPFVFFSASDPKTNNQDFYAQAHKICVEETSKIKEFLRAHHRTFNFKIQTYLVSYCVYTAATIDIYDIKSDDDTAAAAAAERLAITLKMLESEAAQTPGIKRSIDIIKAQLRTYSEPTQYPPQTNGVASEAQKDHLITGIETR